MKSSDYIVGYNDAREYMKDNLLEAIKEIEKYADRKNFKGISKKDVVSECIAIIKKYSERV